MPQNDGTKIRRCAYIETWRKGSKLLARSRHYASARSGKFTKPLSPSRQAQVCWRISPFWTQPVGSVRWEWCAVWPQTSHWDAALFHPSKHCALPSSLAGLLFAPAYDDTVDGSEIRRSTVEVASLSHNLQGFLHPGWFSRRISEPSTVVPRF